MIKGQARSRYMPVQMYLGHAQSWEQPFKILGTSHLLLQPFGGQQLANNV